MKKLKCLECGGEVIFCQDNLTCKCKYCGNTFILNKPLSDENFIKFQMATEYLDTFKFSDAKRLFCNILEQNEDFYECYWGAFLADYGIQFGLNRFGEQVPTCHRANNQTVFDNHFYKKALFYADTLNKKRYIESATKIENVRKNIILNINIDKGYDVFICFKATEIFDPNRRTIDYEFGNNIYEFLTKKGYKVFFSAKTLYEVKEQEFEPYIYKALSSCRVMLLLCSSIEKIESPWVKNEWGRFLDMHLGNGVVPICGNRMENFSPSALPSELQKYNAIIFDENVLNNIELKVDSFFEDRIKLNDEEKLKKLNEINRLELKNENEKIIQELNEIKKAISQTNLNNSSNKGSYVDENYIIKNAYTYCKNKNFIEANNLIKNNDISLNNPDFFVLNLLIEKKYPSFDEYFEALKIDEEIENDENILSIIKLGLNPYRNKIENALKNFVLYVANKEEEFAKKSTIINGNLIKYIEKEQDDNVIMCQGIETIKEKSLFVRANTFTISQSVKVLEENSFISNLPFEINNPYNSKYCVNIMYVPDNVVHINKNAFRNYLNKDNGIINFETNNTIDYIDGIEASSQNEKHYKFKTFNDKFKDKISYGIKPKIFERLEKIFRLFPDLENTIKEKRKKIQEYLDYKNSIYKKIEAEKNKKLIEASIPQIQNIFKFRKYFEENSEIKNGVLIKYNGDNGKVYIPDFVNKISSKAFNGYNKLYIVLPENIKLIENSAFYNINDLTLFIPKSTNKICDNAITFNLKFGGKKIDIFCEDNEKLKYKDIVNVSDYVKELPILNKNFYVKSDFQMLYEINPSLIESLIQEEQNIRKEKELFLEKEKNKIDLEIKKNLEMLEDYKKLGFIIKNNILLDYVGNSENVVIPNGISVITENAFRNNDNIKFLTIADTVTKIDDHAFVGMSKLEKIILGKNISVIPKGAFNDCHFLNEIIFNDRLKIIESEAFENCISLKKLILPQGLEIIKSYSFIGCENLSKIEILSKKISIEKFAFFKINKLAILDFSSLENFSDLQTDFDIIEYSQFLKKPIRLKIINYDN